MFGNVWGIPSLDENRRRFSAFTKDDNRKLQVVQNKIFRLQTGLPQDTPLPTLLEKAKSMSVMQLTAFHTLTTVHRVVSSGQPGYLAERLKVRSQAEGIFPLRQTNTIAIPDVELTLSRGGFLYRGACLWNNLPVTMRSGMSTATFKREVRTWVRTNIGPRPP